MGTHRAAVWGRDCWSAQLKVPAQDWQLCLAHQLRNLQVVVDRDPTLFWAPALQALFRYAIHLHQQRDQLPAAQFAAQVARSARLGDWLLARPVTQPEALRLQQRYCKHRQHLFVFLERTDVAPTNNVIERALRASVVHRKVLGGFRSQWGAEAYAPLASIIDTAALKGIKTFAALRTLMGPRRFRSPTPVSRYARFVLSDLHYTAPNVQECCDQAGQILVTTHYGSYPHTGDGVEVRRIFHKLRSLAIESFNEQFKGIFDGHGQVPTKGLATQHPPLCPERDSAVSVGTLVSLPARPAVAGWPQSLLEGGLMNYDQASTNLAGDHHG